VGYNGCFSFLIEEFIVKGMQALAAKAIGRFLEGIKLARLKENQWLSKTDHKLIYYQR
jgi:hypothetical protein